MIDSNNIEIIRDNLKELDQKIENLDVEIPPHTAGDVGKYLGVDASGDLEFSKVPDELPATTSATAGQILTLDSNKDPEWADNYNLNYSASEQRTGKKWIDGKDVYKIVFTGNSPDSETGFVDLPLVFDKIITMYGTIENLSGGILDLNKNITLTGATNKTFIRFTRASAALYDVPYILVVLYTKPDPTREDPEPETKKKKSK